MTPTVASKRLVRVVFDDGEGLAVPVKAAEGAGARPGVAMLPAAVAELHEVEVAAAMQRAIRRLARADRTEHEVRRDLRTCHFSDQAVTVTIRALRAQGLLNDVRSAEHFVAARTRSHPRSRRLLRMELKGRGVDAPTAEAVTADVDDDEGAFVLAKRRGARAPRDSYRIFLESIGPYLQRRGYDYQTTERAARRAWEALEGG